ncbi:MAG: MucB/RseB C-terminal domain-containing protein [Burkholderiaceae bacterium]|nr:MucB/RseB C-terminal domain-containing protein [Burkholderiaceae bacterium]
MKVIALLRLVLPLALLLALAPAGADTPAAVPGERSISEWLQRMHEASRRRAYIGTLVVSSGSAISSARVWHVCDGRQQMERVEALTGTPRSTFRRNDEVITFSPQSRVAVVEKRESLGLFPQLLKVVDAAIDQNYGASTQGSERVAGFEADVVQLQPRDGLRFGYRIWSEKKTGLMLKLQTLDAQGRVLEQVAFSELQLDAPVSMDKLKRMMSDTDGYKLETPALVKTTPQAEGWRLAQEVPGFRPMSCYRRPAPAGGEALQWVFSDGLATVSLFIEPYDPRRHVQEGQQAMGATHALVQRGRGAGAAWWLTLVGEVPAQTLQAFAQGLERLP